MKWANLFAKGVNYLAGNSLRNKGLCITSSLIYLGRKRKIDKNYFDYIRLSVLELISFEINKKRLEGSIAEVGVFKGKFARYINEFFPDRKFYLFDTFQGFDERDVHEEKFRNLSSGTQDFSDTSVSEVLDKMSFPNACIPVKGFFPESAVDIQDQFVFVSLDADLYTPIYSGLTFFFPKLVTGGYILIHDFNNDNYSGVRKAVEQFCLERGINFTPIPDASGSVIICK